MLKANKVDKLPHERLRLPFSAKDYLKKANAFASKIGVSRFSFSRVRLKNSGKRARKDKKWILRKHILKMARHCVRRKVEIHRESVLSVVGHARAPSKLAEVVQRATSDMAAKAIANANKANAWRQPRARPFDDV